MNIKKTLLIIAAMSALLMALQSCASQRDDLISNVQGSLVLGGKVERKKVIGFEQVEMDGYGSMYIGHNERPVVKSPSGDLFYGVAPNGKLGAFGFSYDAAKFLSTHDFNTILFHFKQEAEKISGRFGEGEFSAGDDYSYWYKWKARINGRPVTISYTYREARNESSPAYIAAIVEGGKFEDTIEQFLGE